MRVCGDLFYTMNKEAAARDLGLTLQTAFVTKALLGLLVTSVKVVEISG